MSRVVYPIQSGEVHVCRTSCVSTLYHKQTVPEHRGKVGHQKSRSILAQILQGAFAYSALCVDKMGYEPILHSKRSSTKIGVVAFLRFSLFLLSVSCYLSHPFYRGCTVSKIR